MLVELLQLLELSELLRMLLESSLQLRLLGSLAIYLSRWLGLRPLTRWDVCQTTASWNSFIFQNNSSVR